MQVVVLGCGPGGMLAANALARAGTDVVVVGPVSQPWTNTYGTWVDELVGSNAAFHRTYDQATIRLENDHQRVIERAYGVLDNRRTMTRWLDALLAAGGTVHAGLATIEDREKGRVLCDDGTEFVAPLVIDARGGSGGKASLWQQAVGLELEVPAGVLPDFLMMDYATSDEKRQPSFLYAMRMDDQRVFVEETVLCTDSPLPWPELTDRLRRRLSALGIEAPQQLEPTELCLIPMDIRRRNPEGAVVPFGAAAGFVHPATGYSLGFAAAAAERLSNLTDPSPMSVRRAVWPADQLATDSLFRFGGALLARWSRDELRSFMAAFLDQPRDLVDGYFSRTASPAQVRELMFRTYRRAPAHLRTSLRGALWREPAAVLRSFLPQSQPEGFL